MRNTLSFGILLLSILFLSGCASNQDTGIVIGGDTGVDPQWQMYQSYIQKHEQNVARLNELIQQWNIMMQKIYRDENERIDEAIMITNEYIETLNMAISDYEIFDSSTDAATLERYGVDDDAYGKQLSDYRNNLEIMKQGIEQMQQSVEATEQQEMAMQTILSVIASMFGV